MTVDNLQGHGGVTTEAGFVVPDQRILDIRAKIAATNLSKNFEHHSEQIQGDVINFITAYLDYFASPTDKKRDIYNRCLTIVEAKPNIREMAVWLAPRVREQIRKNSPEMNVDDN